ncbi:MAG: uroporphyrinogen-III synthase, partial [Actinomycetota bacterium]|nr:uroporphyrinogen-III synthase [Actinomycetota bacterium]
STAEGVWARGGRVLAVGDGGLRSLLDEFDPKGRTVAYPHAEGTDAVGLRLLEQGARRLVAVAVYRSVPRGPGTDPVEAAAFASPSAVEGWCMTRSLADIRVGAIGPTTAAALEQRGRRADVVASSSSYRMLAEGLAALGVG